MKPELEGTLVKLRRIRNSDCDSIQRNANDRDVAKYLGLPYPYKLKDAESWVRRANRLFRNSMAYNFGIEDKEGGEIAGMIGLRRINLDDRNAEVGYWLGREFRGKGYIREALDLILRYSFDNLKLARVYAVVHATNVPSRRVLEKAGFRHEGTWRRASFMGRRWNDIYSYGILKSEYNGGDK